MNKHIKSDKSIKQNDSVVVVTNIHYAVTLEVLSFLLYTCVLTSLPCLEALQDIIF